MSDPQRMKPTVDLYRADGGSGGATGQAEARYPVEPGLASWTTDSWREALLAADPAPEAEPSGLKRFIDALRGFIALHEPDPEAQQRALEQALADMNTPEFASWIAPLSGVSTAVAAGIRGENPLAAARDQGFSSEVIGYDEQGNPIDGVAWNNPDVATELINRGTNPVLAMAIDMMLVPDPTGVGKAADLIPLLSFVGPVGMRMMARHGKNLQFIPPSFFDAMSIETTGLRRAPRLQTEFARDLAEDPRGIMQPVVLGFDLELGRVYILDGHHRMTAALERDMPVPTVGYRTSAEAWLPPSERDTVGMRLPDEVLERLRTQFPEAVNLDDMNDGLPGPWERGPSQINPAEAGFPVASPDSLMNLARQHADNSLSHLTDEDIVDIGQTLTNVARGQQGDAFVVNPQFGTVPDYTRTIENGAQQRRMRLLANGSPEFERIPDDPREYMQYMVEEYGWDEGLRLIGEDTGLTPDEIMLMHNHWVGMERGMYDEMHAGGILARSPDMPTEPPYPLGEDPRYFDFSDINQVSDEVMSGARAAAKAQQWADPASLNRLMDQITNLGDPQSNVRMLQLLRQDAEGIGRMLPEADAQRVLDMIDQRIAQVEFDGAAAQGAVAARRGGMKPDPRDVIEWEPEMGEVGFSYGEMANDAKAGNSSLAFSELEAVRKGLEGAREAMSDWRNATAEMLAEAEYWMNAAARLEQADYALRLFPTMVGRRSMEELYVLRSGLNDLYRKAGGLPSIDRQGGLDALTAQLGPSENEFNRLADEGAQLAGDAPRFNTGNTDLDASLNSFSQRIRRVNQAIDSGDMTPEAAAEANSLFSDMITFVERVQAMPEDEWLNRSQDLDEGLMMVNEFLDNIRRNVDPAGGGFDSLPPAGADGIAREPLYEPPVGGGDTPPPSSPRTPSASGADDSDSLFTSSADRLAQAAVAAGSSPSAYSDVTNWMDALRQSVRQYQGGARSRESVILDASSFLQVIGRHIAQHSDSRFPAMVSRNADIVKALEAIQADVFTLIEGMNR